MAFFELRQYEIRPGKMAEWLEFMQNEIIPFQVSKGMVICGSFRGEEDESVYVWIRRFESEEQWQRFFADYERYVVEGRRSKVEELVQLQLTERTGYQVVAADDFGRVINPMIVPFFQPAPFNDGRAS